MISYTNDEQNTKEQSNNYLKAFHSSILSYPKNFASAHYYEFALEKLVSRQLRRSLPIYGQKYSHPGYVSITLPMVGGCITITTTTTSIPIKMSSGNRLINLFFGVVLYTTATDVLFPTTTTITRNIIGNIIR